MFPGKESCRMLSKGGEGRRQSSAGNRAISKEIRFILSQQKKREDKFQQKIAKHEELVEIERVRERMRKTKRWDSN